MRETVHKQHSETTIRTMAERNVELTDDSVTVTKEYDAGKTITIEESAGFITIFENGEKKANIRVADIDKPIKNW